jgi:predicted RNase H-like HicB family nuclease
MKLAGRIFKSGRWWVAEVPILDVSSQGRTRAEAKAMLADAIEELVNRVGFKAIPSSGDARSYELGSNDAAALAALLLRRARVRSGLSLAEVAERLGEKSINGYARYEQGRAVPSIAKFARLFAAVGPAGDLLIDECRSLS